MNGGVPGFNALMCPEQKNTAWIEKISHKFTMLKYLVVDTCAGTFSVVNISILLPKQRSLIVCDMNPGHVIE